MKYALISPLGRILRTSATAFKFTPEGREVSEITDEQAEQLETSVEIFFLIEGKLVSLAAKRWAEDPDGVKASLRPERDRLLAASDWTQLNDTTLPEDHIAAWAAYRQDLRDLTDEIDENGEVDFPEKP
tara:strand:+ start:721 stop:1107 length:387 start_codon:yes stop_codon:yes gene_type:complete